MLKINKKVEYALMALRHMASKDQSDLTSAREICERYGAPFDTTSKILQQLANAHIVQSIQGVKGGYTLKMDLNELSFVRLCEIVEKKNFFLSCIGPSGRPCELISTCNIKSPLDVLNYKLRSFFDNLTIAELLTLPDTQPETRNNLGQVKL